MVPTLSKSLVELSSDKEDYICECQPNEVVMIICLIVLVSGGQVLDYITGQFYLLSNTLMGLSKVEYHFF